MLRATSTGSGRSSPDAIAARSAKDELGPDGVDRPCLGTQAGELRFLDLADSHDGPPSCGSVS
jgi:hypothetical protein